MAGKSRQPSHESHAEGEKTGTCYTDKTVKRKGGTEGGRGDSLQGNPMLRRNTNTQKNTDYNVNKTATMPYGPRTRGILAHAHI